MSTQAKRRLLPPRFVATMLSGHSVLGLGAAALLYVLCLSGTLAVFYAELERWENPAAPELESIAPAATARAAEAALTQLDSVPHHLYVSQPVDGMPRVVISTDDESWFADASGRIVGEAETGFTEFLLDLHYYLHLPGVVGLTLVGMLGVAMTALIGSGLLAHPRLLRDAFALRLGSNRQLREADIHNRLGVWAGPFHLAIAVTGSALGLASVLALVVGNALFDGDSQRLFEPTFGAEPESDSAPAPLHDVESALVNFRAHKPDAEPWYVIFHEPGTAGQRGEILARHARRMIYGENYYFDADGRLTGRLGLADGPTGQQLVAGIYPVHFGSFGGLPVKLVYGVLGMLLCVVCASGVNIWLIKRRERGAARVGLENAWAALVWATPACLALTLAVEEAGIAAGLMLRVLFWAALLAAVGAAAAAPVRSGGIARAGRAATAVCIAAAIAAHAAANTGPYESPAAVGVSAVLAAAALMLGVQSARSDRSRGVRDPGWD